MSLSSFTNIDGNLSIPSLNISQGINFENDDVRLGNAAGLNNQAALAIAIGNNAGQNNQGISAISIGTLAGVNNQKQDAIAIGNSAGADEQDPRSISIGNRAGNDTQLNDSIAIGNSAGENFQSEYAVAIGFEAGLALQDVGSVAIGAFAGENSQSKNAIAIGDKAGQANQGGNAIAIGAFAGSSQQHTNTIVFNATGSPLNTIQTNSSYIAPIRNLAKPNILYYDTVDKEITFAPAPSVGVPTLESVLGQGNSAGTNDINMNNQNITNVNQINGTSYPPPPSNPNLSQVLAQGNQAGTNIDMSNNDLLNVGNLGFSQSSVSIGNGSGGKNDNNTKTNVGFECGAISQSGLTVAIGNQCGNNLQKASAVAIGNQAGRFNQGLDCVAIGRRAGDSGQGERAIAIGAEAGLLNQHTKTIILNATSSALNTTNTDSFYVAPIRSATNSNTLFYNTTTKEITHQPNPVIPTPATPNLSAVLTAGAVANTTINMNNNSLTNVSTINGTAYPPPVGSTPNLSAVLAQGNSAGNNNLNMNNQSITGALTVNGIAINSVSNTASITPIKTKDELRANEVVLYYNTLNGEITNGSAPVGCYQTWQFRNPAVLGVRDFNVEYINNRTQPIQLAIRLRRQPNAPNQTVSLLIGGVIVDSLLVDFNISFILSSAIVPPNSTYRVTAQNAAQMFIERWSELARS